MTDEVILWEQRANTKKGKLISFFVFLYEFVGARLTFIAFLALFSVLTYNLKFYGYILTTGVALLIFLFLREAFKTFWTGINLVYKISNQRISFEWGVLRAHELHLQLDEISKIYVLHGLGSHRKALVFDNTLGFKNSQFGFSSELYADILSFERIVELDKVISILGELDCTVEEKSQASQSTLDKLTQGDAYVKLMQLLAFIYLYLTMFIFLSFFDSNGLIQNSIEDTVIIQEKSTSVLKEGVITLKTSEGYKLTLMSDQNYMGQSIKFRVSPLFKNVTNFSSLKSKRYETFLSGYVGGSVIFKLFAAIILLICCILILYKRGVIDTDDLGLIFVAPMFFLFVAYGLFY